jgi:flagellar biosynthesis/type III secretory pathway M-ring protein FliF/YscJ
MKLFGMSLPPAAILVGLLILVIIVVTILWHRNKKMAEKKKLEAEAAVKAAETPAVDANGQPLAVSTVTAPGGSKVTTVATSMK